MGVAAWPLHHWGGEEGKQTRAPYTSSTKGTLPLHTVYIGNLGQVCLGDKREEVLLLRKKKKKVAFEFPPLEMFYDPP